MKCSECGTDNISGAKFCAECGTSLVKTKSCVVCYAVIPEKAKFCPHCKADQSDDPLVLSPSEVLSLQSLFMTATSNPRGIQELKARMKISLTQSEWNSLPGVPEFEPHEKLIVYIPQQDLAIIRNDVVFDHLEFQGSKVVGSLFITNFRVIVVNHVKKSSYSLPYLAIESYSRPGGASLKHISLIFTTAENGDFNLVFVTPASGKANLVLNFLTSLEGKQDHEQDRREDRARDFRIALDEWTALIAKRWH